MLVGQCSANPLSSVMCAKGTKGYEVDHDKKAGIWYRDGASVYVLQETGKTIRGKNKVWTEELMNKFFFRIQGPAAIPRTGPEGHPACL